MPNEREYKMDIQFDLTVNELKAFNLIANYKDATRYYLQGINVQYLPETDKLCFVVTDGHRMMFKVISAPEHMTSDFQSFIIPAATIKQVIIGLKGDDIVTFKNFTVNNVNTYKANNLEFSPVDGTYPDWRRILNPTCKGEIAQFNPAYIGDFGKIAKLVGNKSGYIHIHHDDKSSPAFIDVGNPEYYCVLMPIRSEPINDLDTYRESISDNLGLKWSLDSDMQVKSIAAE
jgi:DNA polymerase-3 subunit beta